MKKQVSVLLLLLSGLFLFFLMGACFANRNLQESKLLLQNHWVHAHEENQGGIRVYRPREYDFKPSRGREEIHLLDESNLLYRPIAPNNMPVTYEGTWNVKRNRLKLLYENKSVTYRIISVHSEKLKLK